MCNISARLGNLSALQWVRNPKARKSGTVRSSSLVKEYYFPSGASCSWDDHMIIYAMRLPLEVIWQYLLQWLRSQGCPWDTRTCIMAASYGYLEVLQWARSQGCPWDRSTCYNAAFRGNLAVLKYMLQFRCWRSFESITVGQGPGMSMG